MCSGGTVRRGAAWRESESDLFSSRLAVTARSGHCGTDVLMHCYSVPRPHTCAATLVWRVQCTGNIQLRATTSHFQTDQSNNHRQAQLLFEFKILFQYKVTKRAKQIICSSAQGQMLTSFGSWCRSPLSSPRRYIGGGNKAAKTRVNSEHTSRLSTPHLQGGQAGSDPHLSSSLRTVLSRPGQQSVRSGPDPPAVWRGPHFPPLPPAAAGRGKPRSRVNNTGLAPTVRI